MITAPESKPTTARDSTPPRPPRVRTHAHLVLVDWEGAALGGPSAPGPRLADAIRRRRAQRLYQRGVVALMLLTGLVAAGLGGH